MKTILIPTDYNPSSFDSIPSLVHQLKNEEINLVFVHMFKLSDSITDLLMLSRRNREYEKVSDEFYKRIPQTKQNYPQIANIRIEFLYGSTLSMFKDFLEDNEIDAVLESDSTAFNPIHKTSIDPSILVKKSGLPVLTANKTFARVKQAETQRVTAPVYNRHELLTEA